MVLFSHVPWGRFHLFDNVQSPLVIEWTVVKNATTTEIENEKKLPLLTDVKILLNSVIEATAIESKSQDLYLINTEKAKELFAEKVETLQKYKNISKKQKDWLERKNMSFEMETLQKYGIVVKKRKNWYYVGNPHLFLKKFYFNLKTLFSPRKISLKYSDDDEDDLAK